MLHDRLMLHYREQIPERELSLLMTRCRVLSARACMCVMQVEPSVQKLYDYIYERGTIVPVEDYSMELLNQGDISKRVTESIRYAQSYLPTCSLKQHSSHKISTYILWS